MFVFDDTVKITRSEYDFVDEKWIENITLNIPDDCTQEEINNVYTEYQKDLEFWSTWRPGRDGFLKLTWIRC